MVGGDPAVQCHPRRQWGRATQAVIVTATLTIVVVATLTVTTAAPISPFVHTAAILYQRSQLRTSDGDQGFRLRRGLGGWSSDPTTGGLSWPGPWRSHGE